MSLTHLNAALKADKLKVKGGALQLLWLICFRAGSGHPFKSGKVVPLGQWRATDKMLLRMMHMHRGCRSTIREWRKKLKAAKVLDWTIRPNRCDGHDTYPVHVYQVNLEKLETMHSKPAHKHERKPVHGMSDHAHKSSAQVGASPYTDGTAPSFDTSHGESVARVSGVVGQSRPGQTGFPLTPTTSLTQQEEEFALSLTALGYIVSNEDTLSVIKTLTSLGVVQDKFLSYLKSKQGAWLPKMNKGQVKYLLLSLNSSNKNGCLPQFNTWLVKKDAEDEVFYRTHCKHCDGDFNTDGVCRAWRECPGGINGNPGKRKKSRFAGETIVDMNDPALGGKPRGFVVDDI